MESFEFWQFYVEKRLITECLCSLLVWVIFFLHQNF